MITASLLLAATPVALPAQGFDNLFETAVNDGRFTTLVAALEATGLDTALMGGTRLTVFAPTDDAFALLPPGTVDTLLMPENLPTLATILLYHVTPDGLFASDVLAAPFLTTLADQRANISLVNGVPMIEDSIITDTDIIAQNGVLHIIDAVLMPNTDDLLQTANAVGGFDLLELAVVSAGLDGALSAPGPFTVFAPTDAAFQALPTDFMRRALLPGNVSTLQTILTYHVVPGRLYAEDVISAGSLTTLQGSTLQVTVSNGDVFIDGARVILADVETANGNIHVIDSVLLP